MNFLRYRAGRYNSCDDLEVTSETGAALFLRLMFVAMSLPSERIIRHLQQRTPQLGIGCATPVQELKLAACKFYCNTPFKNGGITFQETSIERLSPGQYDALRPVFYLHIDNNRNPIIQASNGRRFSPRPLFPSTSFMLFSYGIDFIGHLRCHLRPCRTIRLQIIGRVRHPPVRDVEASKFNLRRHT